MRMDLQQDTVEFLMHGRKKDRFGIDVRELGSINDRKDVSVSCWKLNRYNHLCKCNYCVSIANR
jgi:hypothetical protein